MSYQLPHWPCFFVFETIGYNEFWNPDLDPGKTNWFDRSLIRNPAHHIITCFRRVSLRLCGRRRWLTTCSRRESRPSPSSTPPSIMLSKGYYTRDQISSWLFFSWIIWGKNWAQCCWSCYVWVNYLILYEIKSDQIKPLKNFTTRQSSCERPPHIDKQPYHENHEWIWIKLIR